MLYYIKSVLSPLPQKIYINNQASSLLVAYEILIMMFLSVLSRVDNDNLEECVYNTYRNGNKCVGN